MVTISLLAGLTLLMAQVQGLPGVETKGQTDGLGGRDNEWESSYLSLKAGISSQSSTPWRPCHTLDVPVEYYQGLLDSHMPLSSLPVEDKMALSPIVFEVERPQIVKLPHLMTISEGSNLKLKCNFQGFPSPAVAWLQDGSVIRPSLRTIIHNKRKKSILKINAITKSDSGSYTCRALSVLGVSERSTKVRVRQLAPDPQEFECPISGFCLNGGQCSYFQLIGELICRCAEGFAGQRCQFKKATVNFSSFHSESCGLYGHDVQLREVCAAWKQPPVTEMTKAEYQAWLEVEQELETFRLNSRLEQMQLFRNLTLSPPENS